MNLSPNADAVVVTIGLNALCIGDVDAQQAVFVPPAADYTQLPYRDADHALHNQGPYTDQCASEYGARDPAVTPLITRSRGIHLHWTLPAALTQARISGTNGAVMDTMPAVPNRWLIVRSGTTRTNQTLPQASWVVESDRITAQPGACPAALIPALPADPANPTVQDHLPFAYLGHTQPTPWHEGGDPAARYLGDHGGRLTAIIGGSVHFASLYSECAGVLGFHDPLDQDAAVQAGATLCYDVIGWYADPQLDILHTLPPCPPGADWRDHLARLLDWKVGSPIDGQADPEVQPAQSVYHARLEAICWNPATTYLGGDPGDLDLKKVAIGNSAGEATAALLAHLAADAPPVVEDLVNALMLGALPQLANSAQIETALSGALKEARFRAMSGGLISALKQRPVADGADSAPPGDDVAQQLSQLVAAERAANALARRIDAMRWQVFVDWGKFLELSYGQACDPVAATNLGNLLYLSLTDMTAPLPSALAQLQALRDNELPLLHERLSRTLAGSGWDLVESPDAPFWQPNPPTILLFGDGATPGTLHDRGRPLCRLASAVIAAVGSLGPDHSPQLGDCRHQELIAALLALRADPASPAWQAKWNPLMLAWSVQFAPAQYLWSAFSSPHAYPPAFLTDRYNLPVEGELHYKGATGIGPYQDYSGLAFVTPRPRQTIAAELQRYVQDHPSDPIDPDLAEIVQALQAMPILTQSLGGFNEALQMRRSGSQLPVLDPVGDAMKRPLVELVAAAVGAMTATSPQLVAAFNPLRAGFLTPTSLRLIDTFGHCRAMTDFTDKLVYARSMIAPDMPRSTGAELCPRFTQPSRLTSCWLPARNDQWIVSPAAGSSPVFGWVLYNHIDQALAIYNAAGAGIGSFVLTGSGAVAWQAFPASGKSDDPVVAFATEDARLADFALNGLWHWPSAAAPQPAAMLQPLLAALGKAADVILPADFSQTRGNALLLGQPLALIRLAIKLDLYGEPACGEEAAYFTQPGFDPADPPPRWNAGFLEVEVPTQLGGTGTPNDGLVGYFAERAGVPVFDRFLSPFAAATQGAVVQPGPFPLGVQADPTAPPQTFTAICDPRAGVPIETALHPADTLNLDPAHFGQALEAIRVAFFSAPVLTDPDRLAMPLPAQGAGKWRWVYRDGHGWQSTNAISRPSQSVMPSPPKRILQEGWLVLDPAFHDNDEGSDPC